MPEIQRTVTFDDSTHASNPGGLRLSDARLRRLRPDLFDAPRWQRPILALMGGGSRSVARLRYKEQMQWGDGRAAVVMSVQPLLVAAYTDEFDCVAMLRFDDALAGEFGLSPGDRLLTVNAYQINVMLQRDLVPGPGRLQNWNDLYPLIADFLTEDAAALAVRKGTISEPEWRRAESLGREYLRANPGICRDGRPGFAHKPARRVKRKG